jgi:uncharacterized protein (DUF934 family)
MVWVEDDVQELLPSMQTFLQQWPLIAIDFPIYRDGRGFSTAAILRKRAAWQGEIRAIGDVLVDQLIQMARVGFDTFALRADQSLEVGLAAVSSYHVRLQNDWRSRSLTTRSPFMIKPVFWQIPPVHSSKVEVDSLIEKLRTRLKSITEEYLTVKFATS